MEHIKSSLDKLLTTSSFLVESAISFKEHFQPIEDSIFADNSITSYGSLGNMFITMAENMEKVADEANSIIAMLEHDEDMDEDAVDAILDAPTSSLNAEIEALKDLGEKLSSISEARATSFLAYIAQYASSYVIAAERAAENSGFRKT